MLYVWGFVGGDGDWLLVLVMVIVVIYNPTFVVLHITIVGGLGGLLLVVGGCVVLCVVF